ncbi:MAG TPA: hypothetical protein VIF64_19970 [Pyrinomonadaceae bacterium]
MALLERARVAVCVPDLPAPHYRNLLFPSKMVEDLYLKGIDNEVVLLEAGSEEALRRTHRRYFENLTELTTART